MIGAIKEEVAKTRVGSRLKNLLRPYLCYIPGRTAAPSWQRSFRVLEQYGFHPSTVFDIGVAYGTYELYRAFPDAHYHLIDPTRESLHYMRQLGRRLRCDVHPVALGHRDGDAEIEIRQDIQGATLLEDVGEREIVRHDRVPMRRFDSLIGEIARPSLCKIDVQGAELMVLEGMTGRLASLDAVIVETSTIASLKDGPEVHDVVRFMHDHGFVVADIVGITRRPLDGATAQLDVLFVPQDSPLRRDRRWDGA
ncbi:MAG TPA: FkbM family methyltransferase [Dongiaceae bacterium]|jgi:FkbM family methyltransferase